MVWLVALSLCMPSEKHKNKYLKEADIPQVHYSGLGSTPVAISHTSLILKFLSKGTLCGSASSSYSIKDALEKKADLW